MNPLFRIDFSISDSLKIVRKSVLIYETIIYELLNDPSFPTLRVGSSMVVPKEKFVQWAEGQLGGAK